MGPGKRKALDKCTPMGAILDELEKTKASIRAKTKSLARSAGPL